MIACTIVTGAVLGRIRMKGHICGTFFIAGFIYPLLTRYTVSVNGQPFTSQICSLNSAVEVNFESCSPSELLQGNGVLDFAGGFRVHLVGGIAALVCAIFCHNPERERGHGVHNATQEHPQLLNSTLGALILVFGWYGFNAGSVTGLTQMRYEAAEHICIVLTLTAALTGLFVAMNESRFVLLLPGSEDDAPVGRQSLYFILLLALPSIFFVGIGHVGGDNAKHVSTAYSVMIVASLLIVVVGWKLGSVDILAELVRRGEAFRTWRARWHDRRSARKQGALEGELRELQENIDNFVDALRTRSTCLNNARDLFWTYCLLLRVKSDGEGEEQLQLRDRQRDLGSLKAAIDSVVNITRSSGADRDLERHFQQLIDVTAALSEREAWMQQLVERVQCHTSASGRLPHAYELVNQPVKCSLAQDEAVDYLLCVVDEFRAPQDPCSRRYACCAYHWDQLSGEVRERLTRAFGDDFPRHKHLDKYMEVLNGMLCGCVAATTCGNVIHVMGSVVLAFWAAAAYTFGKYLEHAWNIEDTCHAFPVHAMGALVGGLAAGVLGPAPTHGRDHRFCTYYGHEFYGSWLNQLYAQFIGITVSFVIVLAGTLVVYYPLYVLVPEWLTKYHREDGVQRWLEARRNGGTAERPQRTNEGTRRLLSADGSELM
jgi:ammonia channel protein AmtB